jgi:hypothetical protein
MSWMPMAHTCKPSFSGGIDQEDLHSKPARAKSLRDYLENTQHSPFFRLNPVLAGGVAQVVECLSSMHEALSSDPNTAKKIYIKGSKFSVAAKLIPLEKF